MVEMIPKIFRLTKEQVDYIRLKRKVYLDVSFQKYVIAQLCPPEWKKEYQRLKEKESNGK
jgi:hypothetical protein